VLRLDHHLGLLKGVKSKVIFDMQFNRPFRVDRRDPLLEISLVKVRLSGGDVDHLVDVFVVVGSYRRREGILLGSSFGVGAGLS
jgi:hypothetical protein